jgi:hypothetical protein
MFIRRLWKGGGLTVGALANGAFGAFLTPKLLPRAATSNWTGLLLLLPLAFFSALSYLCFRAAMSQTLYMTVPPPTSVSKSFEFTGDLSQTFEPSWHRFTFESPGYAEQFRAANAERIWRKRSEKARKAASRRSILTAVFFAAIAAAFFYGVYEDTHEWFEALVAWLRAR